jgi:hypothetical protein
MKKQQIVTNKYGVNVVNCAKCNEPVGLNGTVGKTGMAWFDPYAKGVQFHKNTKGAQVHYNCLSQKRLDEVKEMEKK